MRSNKTKKSSKKSKNVKRDYESLDLETSFDSILDRHNASVEDLAWLGLLVLNGGIAEPMRKTLRVGTSTISTMVEGITMDENAKAFLSEQVQKSAAKDVNGRTFDIDHDEFLVMPKLLKQRKAGRYVITSNRNLVAEGIKRGIIEWRSYPFEFSRKRVSAPLYAEIRKIADIKRRINSNEEKNGVR